MVHMQCDHLHRVLHPNHRVGKAHLPSSDFRVRPRQDSVILNILLMFKLLVSSLNKSHRCGDEGLHIEDNEDESELEI